MTEADLGATIIWLAVGFGLSFFAGMAIPWIKWVKDINSCPCRCHMEHG
jgi:hypothetical protein